MLYPRRDKTTLRETWPERETIPRQDWRQGRKTEEKKVPTDVSLLEIPNIMQRLVPRMCIYNMSVIELLYFLPTIKYIYNSYKGMSSRYARNFAVYLLFIFYLYFTDGVGDRWQTDNDAQEMATILKETFYYHHQEFVDFVT